MSPKMTEEQIQEYLKTNGFPKHVWQNGSSGLIKRWEEFAEEVEQGYSPDCLIDDYWNDLELRELIHKIGISSRVKEADEKFRAMLTATNIKHYYRERNSDYDFWNYGYPKNATGNFYEQIKRHILQQP